MAFTSVKPLPNQIPFPIVDMVDSIFTVPLYARVEEGVNRTYITYAGYYTGHEFESLGVGKTTATGDFFKVELPISVETSSYLTQIAKTNLRDDVQYFETSKTAFSFLADPQMQLLVGQVISRNFDLLEKNAWLAHPLNPVSEISRGTGWIYHLRDRWINPANNNPIYRWNTIPNVPLTVANIIDRLSALITSLDTNTGNLTNASSRKYMFLMNRLDFDLVIKAANDKVVGIDMTQVSTYFTENINPQGGTSTRPASVENVYRLRGHVILPLPSIQPNEIFLVPSNDAERNFVMVTEALKDFSAPKFTDLDEFTNVPVYELSGKISMGTQLVNERAMAYTGPGYITATPANFSGNLNSTTNSSITSVITFARNVRPLDNVTGTLTLHAVTQIQPRANNGAPMPAVVTTGGVRNALGQVNLGNITFSMPPVINPGLVGTLTITGTASIANSLQPGRYTATLVFKQDAVPNRNQTFVEITFNVV
jgi:hypothetical protein